MKLLRPYLLPVMLILASPALARPLFSAGPYFGAYLVNCPTINNRVLAKTADPAFGAAPLFGAELKVSFVSGMFIKTICGYCRQQTIPTPMYGIDPRPEDYVPDTINTSGTLVLMPIDLNLGYDFNIIGPLGGHIGFTKGWTRAEVTIDSEAIYQDGRYYSKNTGMGWAGSIGGNGGFNLAISPSFEISLNYSYRSSIVKSLSVTESSSPLRTGSTLLYLDPVSQSLLPLPVESTGQIYYFSFKYRF